MLWYIHVMSKPTTSFGFADVITYVYNYIICMLISLSMDPHIHVGMFSGSKM